MLKNVDGTPSESIDKYLMKNSNVDSFYVDGLARDENEVLITQNRLSSPLKSKLNNKNNNNIVHAYYAIL